MRFPYCAYEVASGNDGDVIYRPVVRARFIGPTESADFWALLDTGADETYLTREMADFLGLVPRPLEVGTVYSASGALDVRYADVEIELSDGQEHFHCHAIVGIVDETWPEAILGHRGFLENFDATFLGASREVNLSPNR